ncbi:hypothetical protein E2C06_02515 [Dankookia rubra]|uniref:Uncharacterized protein n=1 Tax=Dankookia rubra TaxID=1442381 RepID=A0A4R5QLT7_9PROT|nr:hypothetical protein [Dankookia rubra]TDH64236.1 hypothetical protein E2C06_02515 [Dankookia rubra]
MNTPDLPTPAGENTRRVGQLVAEGLMPASISDRDHAEYGDALAAAPNAYRRWLSLGSRPAVIRLLREDRRASVSTEFARRLVLSLGRALLAGCGALSPASQALATRPAI